MIYMFWGAKWRNESLIETNNSFTFLFNQNLFTLLDILLNKKNFYWEQVST